MKTSKTVLNRTQLIVIVSLSVVIICIWAGLTIWHTVPIALDSQQQLPIRSLTITIDESQRGELFTQLQNFADRHGFDYNYADFGTGGENFKIEMLRDDTKIIVNNVAPDPGIVNIRF